MAYAYVCDVEKRMTRELSEEEKKACDVLLDDVAVLIDSINEEASEEAKEIVSCRVVARMFGNGIEAEIPVGATQGSMSALGYAQTWTIGNGGASGELYLTKTEKQLLGAGNKIGSHSPLEDMVCRCPRGKR